MAKTLDQLQTDNEAALLGRFADLSQQLRKRLLDLIETLASDEESSED